MRRPRYRISCKQPEECLFILEAAGIFHDSNLQPMKRLDTELPEEIRWLEQLKRYCAYQERCHAEVISKMEQLKVPYTKHDELIAALISENYLNEERFAKLYAVSKLRQKSWGLRRIKMGLKERGVSTYCVEIALKSIDQIEYSEILKDSATKKSDSIHEPDPWIKQQKLSDYLIRKGFEPERVWKIVKELVPVD